MSMKSIAELLAEYVGRTGADEIAYLVAEIEGLERAIVDLTMYAYTAAAEGQRVIKEADRYMTESQTPERRAQTTEGVDKILKEAQKKQADDIIARLEAAEATGDDAEMTKVVDGVLTEIFGKAPGAA